MSEASSLLLDDDGNLKPLNKFTEDVKKLNDTYNDNYLRAERNFATKSAQSAAKWQKYEAGKDRYDLRYLTDNGPNVRDSHRALEFTTLPVDDPFWNQYTPPNGYNCHCFLVQVRKGEYPVSDSTDAIAKGDQATTQIGKDGSNKAAIFRFNPGREMKVMPPDHPYTSGNCGKLSAVWHTLSVMQKIQLAGEADKCRAKKIIEGMSKGGANEKEYRKSIYEKNVEKQYQTVFKSATGKIVQLHQLANESREKYADIIYSAKAMANKDIDVKIQPEINVSDKEARKKIMPGYKHLSANPELLTEHGDYIDVKTPRVWKNINGLAVHASKKQDAEALITDLVIKIEPSKVNDIARRIFLDKNYKKNAVHFVIKGKYYKVERGENTIGR